MVLLWTQKSVKNSLHGTKIEKGVDLLKLWTIQPAEIMDELNEKGYFICNPDKAENLKEDSYKKAYEWQLNEMSVRKSEKPEDVSFPIWAWHTRDWKRKKPDLRCSAYEKRGVKCVCLELEVPDKDVLLSDFDHWHYVLNDMYLDNSTNEEEWEKEQTWFDTLSLAEKETVRRKSWLKIFDITPVDTDWICTGRFIQATFWKLKKDYIKSVQYFIAR